MKRNYTSFSGTNRSETLNVDYYHFVHDYSFNFQTFKRDISYEFNYGLRIE